MAFYYLETSALVKLYVREPGTEELLRLTERSTGNRLAVLTLSQVEVRSAIRRRERARDIDASTAAKMLDQFERHLQATFVRQSVGDTVLDLAATLLDRHVLRAYDAIQLAGCLSLKSIAGTDAPIFVCSDRRLLEAGGAEGLATLNPEA